MRARTATAAALATVLVGTLAATTPAVAAEPPAPDRTFHSDGNPVLGDGSYYSADASPLVVDDTLYVYTGHDEAEPDVGAFRMFDYGVLSTTDVEAGEWRHFTDNLDPDEVFSWATGNAAYAGHVARGADGRFYWYVPVEWENTAVPNRMAIGVAVSDSPVGPWTDPIGEPLLTWTDVFGDSTAGQEVIDPHVLVDDDGAAYLYWGSWGVARMVDLEPSMTATSGPITELEGLDDFYEAPWVFERDGTYYLAYDWKRGGSECTPSNYQACVAYATSPTPEGPWTYQGIILGGTSSTTVHPSIVELGDRWYLTYHTKDAVGGGHFRRSVAIDEVRWDGDRILPVRQTWADDPALRLGTNLAVGAQASASFTEQPPMTVRALNDGRVTTAMLPPDQWGNYRGTTSSHPSDWVMYQWDTPVRIGSTGIELHRDGKWIRPPASWELEYLDASGAWQPVEGATYPTATDVWHDVTFEPVTTTAVRATFHGLEEGPYVHSVSVSEWEVHAVPASGPAEVPDVRTAPGTAPVLPEAVRMPFGDAGTLWVPVRWRDVEPGAYAAAGSFTVEGRALGQADGYVTATVTVTTDAPPPPTPDTTAPVAVASVAGSEGAEGWFSSPVTVRVRADDDASYRLGIETRTGDGAWTAAPGVRHVDVPVSTEGATTVQGRATDAAGNVSAVVERTVRVDVTAPVVGATVDPATRATTVAASDALSGLATLAHRFDRTGEWTEVAPGASVAAPDGLPHTLDVRATDVAGNVTTVSVTVPLDEGTELTGNVAPYGTATASYTSPWEDVAGVNDGTNAADGADPALLGAGWGTWPRVGEQWAQVTWDVDVTVDAVRAWWFQDADDEAGAGLIAPRTWVLQHLDADGVTWHDVELTAGAYTRERDTFNEVTFTPVTTRAVRVLAQSWGEAEGGGSVGLRELQVLAAGSGTGTVVTPAAPTFTPAACAEGVVGRATVEIPTTAGVVYRVDGEVVTGSVEVAADATVTVTAGAAEGHELADGATVLWEHTFEAPGCEQPVEVVPVAPVLTPAQCVDGGPTAATVDVPAVDGVAYTVGGDAVTGTVELGTGVTTVVARPAPGFTFAQGPGAVSYAFRSDAVDCGPGDEVVAGTTRVDGDPRVGEVLSAAHDGWSPDGLRWAYQWLADGEALDGAVGPTLAVGPDLVGARVAVRVTGFGPGLVPAVVTSGVTAPVALGRFEPGAVTVEGHVRPGATLTVEVDAWTPDPEVLTYQWSVGGRPVPGATEKTYRVRPQDRDEAVTVAVTGTREAYERTTVVSPARPWGSRS